MSKRIGLTLACLSSIATVLNFTFCLSLEIENDNKDMPRKDCSWVQYPNQHATSIVVGTHIHQNKKVQDCLDICQAHTNCSGVDHTDDGQCYELFGDFKQVVTYKAKGAGDHYEYICETVRCNIVVYPKMLAGEPTSTQHTTFETCKEACITDSRCKGFHMAYRSNKIWCTLSFVYVPKENHNYNITNYDLTCESRNCPLGLSSYDSINLCLKVNFQRLTWETASLKCPQDIKGGSLVAVTSSKVSQVVKSFLKWMISKPEAENCQDPRDRHKYKFWTAGYRKDQYCNSTYVWRLSHIGRISKIEFVDFRMRKSLLNLNTTVCDEFKSRSCIALTGESNFVFEEEECSKSYCPICQV